MIDPPIYQVPVKGGTAPIRQSQVDRWAKLYPKIDVKQEIQRAIGWLEENPRRRKTERGLPRYIGTWLRRQKPAPLDRQGIALDPPESVPESDREQRIAESAAEIRRAKGVSAQAALETAQRYWAGEG